MTELGHPVMVIAHRGASALRPEHTLEAYAKAIADGADAIEPDLVCTRDGVLVARHENEIGATTDVATRPEFASRQTEKRIDGKAVSGWFTEDFTLAELRRLRTRERLPDIRSTACDGQFTVPTFEEIVALAASESARRQRVIGIVPELKHPTHFASLGLAMEDRLLQALAAHPYTRSAPVMIQSFEIGNLRSLRERLGGAHRNLTLMQLLGKHHEPPYDTAAAGRPTTYGDMSGPSGLRAIAGYADAVGVHKRALALQPDAATARSALVDAAHAAGLQVFAYTFRPENQLLGEAYRDGGSPAARNEAGSIREMRDYIRAGIAGLFTDDPALGRRAVDAGRMQP
jgi:glycerophosphoryl diester phosphodiesterase